MARDRFRGARYPGMDKKWGDTLFAGAVNNTGNNTLLIPGKIDFTVPRTILRIRGTGFVAFNAATTALDEAQVTIGVAVITSDAATVGSSAMPDPTDEADFPWLWYHVVRMFSPFVIDGTGSDDSGALIARFDIDSKAMRRVKPGQALVAVTQYTDVTGTPSLRVGFDARVLAGES